MPNRDLIFILTMGLVIGGCAATSPRSTPGSDSSDSANTGRTISPGAPGQSSRVMSGEEISDTRPLPYTDEDVAFMSGMIAHHAQALEMTALIESRTAREDLLLLGRRINVSQSSEIQLMQKWLRDRAQPVPEATSVHMVNGQPMLMPGMLTPGDMDSLSRASGDEFYEQFLSLMIGHHRGAITMVEELLSATGAAQDTYVFRFASDVDVDQRMEIARMQDMIDALH